MCNFDLTGFRDVDNCKVKMIKYNNTTVEIVHNLEEECFQQLYDDGYDCDEIEEQYDSFIKHSYNKHKKFQKLGLIDKLEYKHPFIKYQMVKYDTLLLETYKNIPTEILVEKIYNLIIRYGNMRLEQSDLAFRNIGVDCDGNFHYIDLVSIYEKESDEVCLFGLKRDLKYIDKYEIYERLVEKFVQNEIPLL